MTIKSSDQKFNSQIEKRKSEFAWFFLKRKFFTWNGNENWNFWNAPKENKNISARIHANAKHKNKRIFERFWSVSIQEGIQVNNQYFYFYYYVKLLQPAYSQPANHTKAMDHNNYLSSSTFTLCCITWWRIWAIVDSDKRSDWGLWWVRKCYDDGYLILIYVYINNSFVSIYKIYNFFYFNYTTSYTK